MGQIQPSPPNRWAKREAGQAGPTRPFAISRSGPNYNKLINNKVNIVNNQTFMYVEYEKLIFLFHGYNNKFVHEKLLMDDPCVAYPSDR